MQQSSPREGNKLAQSSWQIQKNVLFALYVRELKNRFGIFRLGYLWAIAEPVALIAVLSVIRQAFGSQDIAGVPYPLFFAAGILPYLFFQTSINQCLMAIEGNLALQNYKVVKPADGVLARFILEMLIYGISSVLIIGTMVNVWSPVSWNSTTGVFAVLGCLCMLSLGGCFLAAVAGPLYHESKKIVPILMRPLFFLSGIFFAADSIPVAYREILLWNPLLHVSELIRFYMFKGYESNEGSLPYLLVCSLVLLFIGLSTYRMTRIRLATSGEIR